MTRSTVLRAALVAFVLLGTACAHDRGSRRVRPLGGLVIRCEPADAQIYVDDRYVGVVSGLGGKPLMLPVGVRRVELRSEGYFASYHEVKVVRGVRQQLSVKLREQPF